MNHTQLMAHQFTGEGPQTQAQWWSVTAALCEIGLR